MAETKYSVIGKSGSELSKKAAELKIDVPEGTTYKGLQELIATHLKGDQTPPVANKPAAKKTAKTFKDEDGNTFAFSKFTPKAFRFNGKLRTQKQWLEDSDAIADMIESGCVFIEPKI